MVVVFLGGLWSIFMFYAELFCFVLLMTKGSGGETGNPQVWI